MRKGEKALDEFRAKCRENNLRRGARPPSRKGVKLTKEHAEATRRGLTGQKRTPEQVAKLVAVARRGPDNHFWKGGVTPEIRRLRASAAYKHWRTAVFERDNFTCVQCGKVGGRLNADHIKRFADYPELRFEVSNGRTLCVPCHLKTDTFGRWRKPEDQSGVTA